MTVNESVLHDFDSIGIEDVNTISNENVMNKVVVFKKSVQILRKLNNYIKRIMDIAGAIVGIVILLPLICVVKIFNLINKDNGPLFYTQERIGLNGKKFNLFKFRTMCVNSQEILEKILSEDEDRRKEWEENRKFKDDPRVTKIGKILRKTSLDEFPQFINVVLGDMSLVGPRPVIDGEIDKFGIHKDEVLAVKPGVTGYWAANGRSETSYEERVEMEIYYVRNNNIVMDIKILFKTIISVLNKEGAI